VGQRRGDVDIFNYLRDQAGSRSLVFDFSITHERSGSSSHPLQNGHLKHPQDIDAPLHIDVQYQQRKTNNCRQQYADNQNISFLPAIVSISTRMHGEFLRLLFLQAHWETEAHFTATKMPGLSFGLWSSAMLSAKIDLRQPQTLFSSDSRVKF
jgi:hypothetical protein